MYIISAKYKHNFQDEYQWGYAGMMIMQVRLVRDIHVGIQKIMQKNLKL